MTLTVKKPHAVSRLRSERLARSSKPFLARGGSRIERCTGCRLPHSHCLCSLQPATAARAGVCLLMADIEPLKPSNTGWLIADVLADTFAFGWTRTEVDPALLTLLADPQWQPYVVFPSEYAAPERLVTALPSAGDNAAIRTQRPLFILLDATWPEARKMFRKSPYLDRFPVLGLQPQQLSRYRLRRSRRDEHVCTSEVAALCLALAGETRAAESLVAWFDVFSERYLCIREQLPLNPGSEVHQRLAQLAAPPFNPVPAGAVAP